MVEVIVIRTRDVLAVANLIGKLLTPQHDEDFKKALASQNLDTEAPLRFRLEGLEFVEHTRVARLNFVKIKAFRTIERYIQRDNEKFKIYSDWKDKENKMPAITLKLTNSVLENLWNTDYLIENAIVKKIESADLISGYAFDILCKLLSDFETDHLIPSWMEKALLGKEMEQKVDVLQSERMRYEIAIRSADTKIHKTRQDKANLRDSLQKLSAARGNRLLFVLFSILSLGYYAFVNSKTQLERLTTQFNESEQNSPLQIGSLNQEIKYATDQIKRSSDDIENVKKEYCEKINQVEPLADSVVDSTGFVLLKELSGLDYEKIIGVYVIKNRELDKFYVGQSKDVLKRLKNHFTGTEPKNIIFAEDYYQSKFDSKDELFEVKIERLETKDELDKREMELIAEYDAFNNGYNKTAGNI